LKRILDTIGIFSLGAMFGVVLFVWMVDDFNIATHENARKVIEQEMSQACVHWFTDSRRKVDNPVVLCYAPDWMK